MMNENINKDLTSNPVQDEEPDCLLGRSKKEWEDLLNKYPSLGVIAMFVIAGLFWNDCDVIPSLNDYVVTFAAVNLTSGLVKLIFRTEKIKQEGGSSPWLYVDAVLGICLVALAIWGAVLTFGNFDKMGTGPDECHSAIFIAAFVSAVITIAIVVIVIPYEVFVECRKESSGKAESSKEQCDEMVREEV